MSNEPSTEKVLKFLLTLASEFAFKCSNFRFSKASYEILDLDNIIIVYKNTIVSHQPLRESTLMLELGQQWCLWTCQYWCLDVGSTYWGLKHRFEKLEARQGIPSRAKNKNLKKPKTGIMVQDIMDAFNRGDLCHICQKRIHINSQQSKKFCDCTKIVHNKCYNVCGCK